MTGESELSVPVPDFWGGREGLEVKSIPSGQ